MKKVSFEVAKTIKKVEYPQGNTDECYLTANHNEFYKIGQIVDNADREWAVLTKHLADAPTYFEVWTWLWQEKDIHIEIIDSKITKQCYATINDEKDTILFNSVEEAIIAAIEYLVENDLIK